MSVEFREVLHLASVARWLALAAGWTPSLLEAWSRPSSVPLTDPLCLHRSPPASTALASAPCAPVRKVREHAQPGLFNEVISYFFFLHSWCHCKKCSWIYLGEPEWMNGEGGEWGGGVGGDCRHVGVEFDWIKVLLLRCRNIQLNTLKPSSSYTLTWTK